MEVEASMSISRLKTARPRHASDDTNAASTVQLHATDRACSSDCLRNAAGQIARAFPINERTIQQLITRAQAAIAALAGPPFDSRPPCYVGVAWRRLDAHRSSRRTCPKNWRQSRANRNDLGGKDRRRLRVRDLRYSASPASPVALP